MMRVDRLPTQKVLVEMAFPAQLVLLGLVQSSNVFRAMLFRFGDVRREVVMAGTAFSQLH